MIVLDMLAAGLFVAVGIVLCGFILVLLRLFGLRGLPPDERPTQPTCPTCGYILRGLPSNTCPECGRQFDNKLRVDNGESS